jgi:hypothetical protein
MASIDDTLGRRRFKSLSQRAIRARNMQKYWRDQEKVTENINTATPYLADCIYSDFLHPGHYYVRA